MPRHLLYLIILEHLIGLCMSSPKPRGCLEAWTSWEGACGYDEHGEKASYTSRGSYELWIADSPNRVFRDNQKQNLTLSCTRNGESREIYLTHRHKPKKAAKWGDKKQPPNERAWGP